MKDQDAKLNLRGKENAVVVTESGRSDGMSPAAAAAAKKKLQETGKPAVIKQQILG